PSPSSSLLFGSFLLSIPQQFAMKVASILVLLSCLFAIVSSFSLRDLYSRLEASEHPEGHHLVEKQAGFYGGGGIDEIGTIGSRPIISRQDGPHMFLDDNGIPVQQNL
ncbi:hypothetical protein PENTCL1PPCAC_7031, partial [Pristionchus entomophagus]